MTTVLIECPFCGFSRQVPRARIPAHVRKTTCPQCQRQFELSLEAPEPSPEVAGVEEDHGVIHARGAGDWQYWQSLNGEKLAAEAAAAQDDGPLTLAGVFRQGWAHYRQRLVGLTLLMLAGLALALAPWLVPMAAGEQLSGRVWAWPLLVGLGLLGSAYVFTAMLLYVAGDGSLRTALRGVRSHLFGVLWVALLFNYMVLGGFALFLLPGLLFLTWFAFAFFVCVVEHEGGFNALLISLQYVRGRFFNTLGKLLAVYLAAMLLSLVPLLGALLAQPFALACLYVIYHDLRRQKDFRREIPTGFQKLRWVVFGSLGYLLLVPGILLVLNAFDVQRFLPEPYRGEFREVTTVAGRGAGLSHANGGLMLMKEQYRPGEIMKIKVYYRDELSKQAFLCAAEPGEPCAGMIPVTVPPGSFGTVSLQTPTKAGLYELRLYTDYSLSREVSNLEFDVR